MRAHSSAGTSVLGDGAGLRHAALSPAWKQANLVELLTHSFGSTSSGGRIRSSSSTRSSAALSTRRSMWSNETPRTARPLSCCWRPARRRRVRRCTSSASPRRPTRSWSRPCAERPSGSLAEGAAEAAVGYLSRALDEQIDPAARAEVLVGSLLERRTSGPARPTTCGPVSSSSQAARRGAVALELGRALWFLNRSSNALAVFEQALDEFDRKRDPDLYELILAELISSAWSEAQTFPVAEARIGELDLKALHGGLGSEILLATLAHYEYRLGLRREHAIELARRALARVVGERLARVLYDTVVVLARAGLLDEAGSILDQAVAQARRRGDVFNVAFMLLWRGRWHACHGDLRAAVVDLREALDLCVAHGLLVA